LDLKSEEELKSEYLAPPFLLFPLCVINTLTMSRSSTSTYAASSHTEKDLEAGTSLEDILSKRDHNGGSGDSCYDEAIVRVTTTEVDEPEKCERERYNVLSVTKPISKTRTTADLEAVLGTPFEVRWEDGDPEYPMNWGLAKRGWILALLGMQTLVVYERCLFSKYIRFHWEWGLRNAMS